MRRRLPKCFAAVQSYRRALCRAKPLADHFQRALTWTVWSHRFALNQSNRASVFLHWSHCVVRAGQAYHRITPQAEIMMYTRHWYGGGGARALFLLRLNTRPMSDDAAVSGWQPKYSQSVTAFIHSLIVFDRLNCQKFWRTMRWWWLISLPLGVTLAECSHLHLN